MFRGINAVNVDAKGRFAIPTKYRERLQSDCQHKLVMTIDTEERCLLLYPAPMWEEIESKLSQLPSFNPAARRIQRLLIGHATEVESDANGRLLLPTLLRDYADLGKKIILLGQGKKFEIWDEQVWQSRRDHWLQEENDGSGDLPDEVQTLSL